MLHLLKEAGTDSQPCLLLHQLQQLLLGEGALHLLGGGALHLLEEGALHTICKQNGIMTKAFLYCCANKKSQKIYYGKRGTKG